LPKISCRSPPRFPLEIVSLSAGVSFSPQPTVRGESGSFSFFPSGSAVPPFPPAPTKNCPSVRARFWSSFFFHSPLIFFFGGPPGCRKGSRLLILDRVPRVFATSLERIPGWFELCFLIVVSRRPCLLREVFLFRMIGAPPRVPLLVISCAVISPFSTSYISRTFFSRFFFLFFPFPRSNRPYGESLFSP